MPNTLDLSRPGITPIEHEALVNSGLSRRPTHPLTAVALALCLLLAGVMVLWSYSANIAHGAPDARDGPIPVVGDSLVFQATKALQSWNLPSTPIDAEGGSGSAPCDWNTGYMNPLSGHYLKFSTLFEHSRPAAVVFAFTGNPGLEPGATGCVNASRPYSLSVLLASYKTALTQMALYASDHGADVYLSDDSAAKSSDARRSIYGPSEFKRIRIQWSASSK